MNPAQAPRRCVTFLCLLATAAGAISRADAAETRRGINLSYVYPAGGRRGTTFRLVVGAPRLPQNLEAVFSGAGIEARLVSILSPIPPKDREEIAGELRELVRRKSSAAKTARDREAPPSVWSDDDDRRLQELLRKTAQTARAREAPAFGGRAEFDVRIAPDAALGQRDLRIAGAGGISPPLIFHVDDMPEISEPPLSAADVVSVTDPSRLGPWRRWIETPPVAGTIAPPMIVNGQIGPGQCDRHRIEVTVGQHLVVAVSARELRPYLADAVPGWFDAAITLYDPDHRPVASAAHWRFHPDPVLCYEAPRDGVYTLEIRDILYRGREDFVYRIALGPFPYITDMFPLGGPVGAETRIALKGWNLKQDVWVWRSDAAGVFTLPLAAMNVRASPFLRMAADTLPECVERPRRGRGTRQAVVFPVVIHGVIEHPGEEDVYIFEGKAGQRVVAEILARRLGRPLDAFLAIGSDEDVFTPLAFNDDREDRGAGRVTHHADALVETVLPADGRYQARVSDVQGASGSAYAYRLRLSEPRPDFEVRLVPSSVCPRRGATATVTAHVVRRDGFDGEVRISLKDAPPGFSLGAAQVPADKDRGPVEIRTSRDAPPGPARLEFMAEAEIAGERTMRPAVPAEELEQAFAWKSLVPVESFVVWVARPPPRRDADAEKIRRPAAARATTP